MFLVLAFSYVSNPKEELINHLFLLSGGRAFDHNEGCAASFSSSCDDPPQDALYP